jgi:hypothetical protein
MQLVTEGATLAPLQGIMTPTSLLTPHRWPSALTQLVHAQVGAGLHSACTVRWNDKTDGNLAVQWENKTILVLATVYWLAV